MLTLVVLVGALVVLLGAAIFVNPPLMKRILMFYEQGSWLYSALVFRLLLGAVLITVADQCRFPRGVMALGILSLAAGVAGFLMGLDRLRALVHWSMGRSSAVVRAWSVLAIAFGGFLIYVAA
ncbi:MAG: hypothetical protein ACE5FC_11570 [Myxococcota bacterium]